jgi:hypothetical protein
MCTCPFSQVWTLYSEFYTRCKFVKINKFCLSKYTDLSQTLTTKSACLLEIIIFTYIKNMHVPVMWRDATDSSVMRQDATNSSVMWRDATNFAVMWRDATNFTVMWRDATDFTVIWRDATNFAIIWRDATNFTVMWRDATHLTVMWWDSTKFTRYSTTILYADFSYVHCLEAQIASYLVTTMQNIT